MSKFKAQNFAGGREGDHPKEENFQPENASSPSDKDAHHAHQQGRGQQIQPSTPKKARPHKKSGMCYDITS
ncbi:hypothetical protein [uncultured Ruminococcus sp.]|uniref:hypothetical protein n=1 Tax=uncultured Ruminococcus sp. TaxID=165186 RepID=UPI0025CBD0C0|nr:hypothetical protein [uncultured Ruminococcus sp.]